MWVSPLFFGDMGKVSEVAESCDAAAGWAELGQPAGRFRSESSRHHKLGAIWQLERQFIQIYRDSLGLWCGVQHRQTVIR